MNNVYLFCFYIALYLSSSFAVEKFTVDQIMCGVKTPFDTIKLLGIYHKNKSAFCGESTCVQITLNSLDTIKDCSQLFESFEAKTLKEFKDGKAYLLVGKLYEFNCDQNFSIKCPYQTILKFQIFNAKESSIYFNSRIPKFWSDTIIPEPKYFKAIMPPPPSQFW